MSETGPITVHSNAYRQPIRTNIDYIFKHSIMKQELWDPSTIVNICKYLVDGTDFFDIGANIGLITLGVDLYNNHNQQPKRQINKIHCFECNPEIFDCLKYNMKAKTNVNLYNFALADKEQLCNMRFNYYNNGNTIIKTVYENGNAVDVPVNYANPLEFERRLDYNVFIPAFSLDTIMLNFTTRVSVIKLDVEGFECKVIHGAKQFLEVHRPTLICELAKDKFQEANELLVSYNYKFVEQIGDDDYVYIHLLHL